MPRTSAQHTHRQVHCSPSSRAARCAHFALGKPEAAWSDWLSSSQTCACTAGFCTQWRESIFLLPTTMLVGEAVWSNRGRTRPSEFAASGTGVRWNSTLVVACRYCSCCRASAAALSAESARLGMRRACVMPGSRSTMLSDSKGCSFTKAFFAASDMLR